MARSATITVSFSTLPVAARNPYETPLQKNQAISALMRIGHGDLKLYWDAALPVAKGDPDLFGHLLAWNQIKGEVRDSQVAFPVIALRAPIVRELIENSVANLAKLAPRELLRAFDFNNDLLRHGAPIVAVGGGGMFDKMLAGYLRYREAHYKMWEGAAVRNRAEMVRLYRLAHIKPADFAQAILFNKTYKSGSIFEAISALKSMSDDDAAAAIINFKIPAPIAIGALRSAKSEAISLALINSATGTELLNMTDTLRKLGVFDNGVLKAAYDAAIDRAKGDKRVGTLKASNAAKKLIEKGASADVIARVQDVQETKSETVKIDGDWAVLADKSGSMSHSIEIARQISATLARHVAGNVHLVFFNTEPTYYDVSHKTLSEITEITRRVTASGGTSIGCALDYLRERKIVVDGVVIVSDGAENQNPMWLVAYPHYVAQIGAEPICYLFRVSGESNVLTSHCEAADLQLETYNVGSDVDYNSIPAMLRTVRTKRYELLDEIMNTPLLTLDGVFA